MTKQGNSELATAIADDMIVRGGGALTAEDRDALRAVIRIGFELLDAVAPMTLDARVLDWTHETLFSGCDSIFAIRGAWRSVKHRPESASSEVTWGMLPANGHEFRIRLYAAIGSVKDEAALIDTRLMALNELARLELIFLGATLW